MKSTLAFYTRLKAFDNPAGISDPNNFSEVPNDWAVYLADIRGSTVAIEAGKYKEINLVGVSAIAAVKNACGRADIPYVFGGDGATFLLPPEFDSLAQAALLGSQKMAKDEFSFDLRVKRVPVSFLKDINQTFRIGKYRISPL